MYYRILQCHGGDGGGESSSHVSVSTPPIVDMTFRQLHSGDCSINILVERIRLNLSMPLLLELGRFVMDALPGDRSCDGGVINHGYVSDSGVQVRHCCLSSYISKSKVFSTLTFLEPYRNSSYYPDRLHSFLPFHKGLGKKS